MSDARTLLWAVGAAVVLLAILSPIRTKWLEVSVSRWQRVALAVAGVAFLALPALVGTGREDEAAGRTEPGADATSAGVLAAPQIQFFSRFAQMEGSACLSAAETALRAAGLTGVESNGRDVAWGHEDRNTGAVWCNASQGLLYVVVAGPSVERGQELVETIRRSFPG